MHAAVVILLGIVAFDAHDLLIKAWFEREKYLALHFCGAAIRCAAVIYTRGIFFFPQVYSLVQVIRARGDIPNHWK